MALLYVMIRPVGVEEGFMGALQAKDPDELLKFSSPLVRAFKDLRDWTEQSMGRILCEFSDIFCCVIPIDKATELTQFLKKFSYTAKTAFSVGLGANPLEAFYAMQASEADHGQKVVIYTDDVEHSAKSNMSQSESAMSKQEGRDGAYGLIFPQLDLSEVEGQQEQQQVNPQPESQGTESIKQKVMQALMNLKQNAQLISQLKQSSPEAFNAIKSLVDAMLALAKEPQGQQPQEVQKSESDPMARLQSPEVNYMELHRDNGYSCGNCEYIKNGYCDNKLVKSEVSSSKGCCNLFYPKEGEPRSPKDWKLGQ